MKLSISNIAWNSNENEEIIVLLNKLGIRGIEIAPTKIWDRPLDSEPNELLQFKQYWEQRDIHLIAMQSLLFGQHGLALFSDVESRNKLKEYVMGIMGLAGKIGVKALVFGSPKNRLSNGLSKNEQLDIAIPFFTELAESAVTENVTLCIEPNPSQYGCDFITNSEEGLQLVREVNHPGFQLHLDAGTLTLNNENISSAIENSMPYLSHFHISEPYLNKVGSEESLSPHREIAKTLKINEYKNWVSIEMKNGDNSNAGTVERALKYASEIYV
ncbi:sugar phosphate isomerase/epimerase [Paenibacillus sp. EKM212P]|uniref:sugar phosphate isomerase/epimerase family protein n=1 Tax=Paenibacillus sp. EKM212P TaxID=1683680 RepID=UPI0013E9EECB|nr:sugar phosphate isomerase/epimerase family protein [Paenibacillus sp. EKM212P]KAF6578927.1 sugar phosphate isomerase/epimerase [Paenibacillus sp. EKM212P]